MKKLLLVMAAMLGLAATASLAQDGAQETDAARAGYISPYSIGFRGGILPDPNTARIVGTLHPETLTGDTREAQWHCLAARMADRVWSAIHYEKNLTRLPIKVFASNSRPFSLAFGDMLVSELVSRGVDVVVGENPRAIPLSYHALVVPGETPAVVLNMSLWDRDEQIVNVTNSFLVAKDDIDLYYTPDAPGIQVPVARTRMVPIVSK